MSDDVQVLLAEGMVVSKGEPPFADLECAAPILRTVMLRQVSGAKIIVDSCPANLNNLDPHWLLRCTIEVGVFKVIVSSSVKYHP